MSASANVGSFVDARRVKASSISLSVLSSVSTLPTGNTDDEVVLAATADGLCTVSNGTATPIGGGGGAVNNLGNGTIGAPSIAFAADTTSGIYRTGTAIVTSLTTGLTSAFRVQSSDGTTGTTLASITNATSGTGATISTLGTSSLSLTGGAGVTINGNSGTVSMSGTGISIAGAAGTVSLTTSSGILLNGVGGTVVQRGLRNPSSVTTAVTTTSTLVVPGTYAIGNGTGTYTITLPTSAGNDGSVFRFVLSSAPSSGAVVITLPNSETTLFGNLLNGTTPTMSGVTSKTSVTFSTTALAGDSVEFSYTGSGNASASTVLVDAKSRATAGVSAA